MFDKVEIIVRSGKGGDGAVSFRREKFVPFGGPDGGDGGRGGAVIIKANTAVSSLRLLRQGKLYRAEDGGRGRAKKQSGRAGVDLVLEVPAGTVVSGEGQPGDDTVLADLAEPAECVVVAKGGRGGLGNTHFASSINQAPQIAQKGETGEEKSITLELKLIADVGIVGYPNVGKSSLLAASSAARPKIASYPFTTLGPVLGVVETSQWSFVMSEIPGLIADAHLGRGLGHDFLRHVVRTKVLLHVVDGSSASPAEDVMQLNNELRLFDSALAKKPQLVAVNKLDLSPVRARLSEIENAFAQVGIVEVHFISAESGEGVSELMAKVWAVLERLSAGEKATREVPVKVFRPKPRRAGVRVYKEGDIFVVAAPELGRTVAGTNVRDLEARRQLMGWLARAGVDRALQKAGIKPGDRVRLGELEWKW